MQKYIIGEKNAWAKPWWSFWYLILWYSRKLTLYFDWLTDWLIDLLINNFFIFKNYWAVEKYDHVPSCIKYTPINGLLNMFLKGSCAQRFKNTSHEKLYLNMHEYQILFSFIYIVHCLIFNGVKNINTNKWIKALDRSMIFNVKEEN